MQIQFIGCGNMGEIILQSIISNGFNTKNISVKTKTEDTEIKLKKLYNVNIGLNSESDILILAIKPKQFQELNLSNFSKNILVISIMAGISIDKIKSKITTNKIIRSMPNTPMSVGKGVIGYLKTDNVINNEFEFFTSTFSKAGKLIECDNEDEIDKITALSGSGPAYFYYFTEIIKQKAMEMGFSEEESTIISNNTFIGASNLLEKNNLTIEILRHNITSPGGTTEKAIETFKSNGFEKCITDAINNAYNKAKDLNIVIASDSEAIQETGNNIVNGLLRTSQGQTILENLQKVKIASKTFTNLSFEKRNEIISEIGKAIIKNKDLIKKENQKDLNSMDITNPMYDRLLLSDDRIASIGKGCDELVDIKDPLKKYNLEEQIETKDGLTIKKIGVPLGVVACIYEARPNVTIDLIIMCIKSGNAIILRGGKEAKNSNNILVEIVKKVLKKNLIDENLVYNYPLDREELNILYNAIGLVDVIIPRGGKNLIDSVRKNSIVPVIETGAGVVHLYLDNDIENNFLKAIDVIINAKISRPSVCNALDTLLINKNISGKNISYLLEKLKQAGIIILDNLNDNDYHIEQLSYILSIKYVNNIEEAINHIEKYSSKHSDGILTENKEKVKEFYSKIDSGVVYANTSTRFSDGSCFGFGGEIGISTQKLHARGPMGAESLVTYKYVVESDFKVR